MTPHRIDFVPLGLAPRPSTGDDLADRVRQLLATTAGPGVRGLDRVRATGTLDGADVASFELDLTGVTFSAEDRPALAGWSAPAEARREPAVARRLRLDAHPLTAIDLPVDVTAEAEGIRFTWVEGTDGTVGAQPVEPDAAHPVSGHARVAVDQRGLAGMVKGLLAVTLASQGATLTDLSIDITARGPRAVVVHVHAKVRKGLLAASVEATASAAVDESMVLVVDDVQLRSGNPLVGAMLAMARGRVEAVAKRRIDLQAALPPGVRLSDVRLEAGEQLVLTARLG